MFHLSEIKINHAHVNFNTKLHEMQDIFSYRSMARDRPPPYGKEGTQQDEGQVLALRLIDGRQDLGGFLLLLPNLHVVFRGIKRIHAILQQRRTLGIRPENDVQLRRRNTHVNPLQELELQVIGTRDISHRPQLPLTIGVDTVGLHHLVRLCRRQGEGVADGKGGIRMRA